MRNEDKSFIGIMPIYHTIIFEMKKQRKKLYFFTAITIIIAVLTSYILQLFPEYPLSDTQAEFFSGGLNFISFITLFAACLFFSGIICSEFNKRTGFIVFPKINKYKLIIGKYFGNLILVVFIVFLYYGGPINIRFFYSFGFAVLYVIGLSSFVTLFSSFMKNVNITIITTLVILLMGFNIADQIINLIFADAFEPLYSLAYLGGLITSVLLNPFPNPRYGGFSPPGMPSGMMGGDFSFETWLTPSIFMGTTLLLVYIVACFLLAAILFKRRQL
ncbi:MAG: ABC transporter permease [Promethearchaeota archaeon]|jgi:ABC-type transport system involved in multi-copper enzyme maturation permease subunit